MWQLVSVDIILEEREECDVNVMIHRVGNRDRIMYGSLRGGGVERMERMERMDGGEVEGEGRKMDGRITRKKRFIEG